MVIQAILRQAFENTAAHISNLEEMKVIIDRLSEECASVSEAIDSLENKMNESEVTLVTDIRILINELRHSAREKTS
ncbi:MAG: hypothetical protein ACFFD3_12695 [Candidatus Thorarchaeota archaeon]